jgi:hypothetical protein
MVGTSAWTVVIPGCSLTDLLNFVRISSFDKEAMSCTLSPPPFFFLIVIHSRLASIAKKKKRKKEKVRLCVVMRLENK